MLCLRGLVPFQSECASYCVCVAWFHSRVSTLVTVCVWPGSIPEWVRYIVTVCVAWFRSKYNMKSGSILGGCDQILVHNYYNNLFMCFFVFCFVQHLNGETPTSFSEMSCDACMKSHDFLSAYQLRTNPVTITKEENGAAVSVTDTPPTTTCEASTSSAETKSDSFKTDDKDGSSVNVCELVRRQRLLSNCEGGDRKREAGFFEENWRSQLCTCDLCMVSVVLSGL